MTEPEFQTTSEDWVYGGLRLSADGVRCGSWRTTTGEWLLFRIKGQPRWVIGGIYTVTVSRTGTHTHLHDIKSARFVGTIDDPVERARLEVVDATTRSGIAATALERDAKQQRAIDEALVPLLEIAARLTTWQDVQALLNYIDVKVHLSRRRPR